jgi:hypothetical protein
MCGSEDGLAAWGAQKSAELWDSLGRGLGVGVPAASIEFQFCEKYESYL